VLAWAVSAVSAHPAFALDQPRETVLYDFAGLPDGRYPVNGLLLDRTTGALFGTTSWGGSGNCPYIYPPAIALASAGFQLNGCGTVFALEPPSAGGTAWRERVLYSFPAQATNEYNINPSALVEDRSRVLYGATTYGGGGTVFALSPPAADGRAWRFNLLATLNSRVGRQPYSGVVMDASGALYGTTSVAAPKRWGTVFQLLPPASGAALWQFSLVFGFNGKNGSTPVAPLAIGHAGELYGTTYVGGAYNLGEVFRLRPSSSLAPWTETTLLSFTGKSGAYPEAPVIVDKRGDLYGTTSIGGPGGRGTVFQLSLTGNGWRNSVLWGFGGADGAVPTAGLIMDATGALYGTTSAGGRYGRGTAFKLSPPLMVGTPWTLTVLHDFRGRDGDTPAAPLMMDGSGGLYGTTLRGGTQNYGVVFKVGHL
jgi:uncharacterized repeat protein (TIGR03803 family)